MRLLQVLCYARTPPIPCSMQSLLCCCVQTCWQATTACGRAMMGYVPAAAEPTGTGKGLWETGIQLLLLSKEPLLLLQMSILAP